MVILLAIAQHGLLFRWPTRFADIVRSREEVSALKSESPVLLKSKELEEIASIELKSVLGRRDDHAITRRLAAEIHHLNQLAFTACWSIDGEIVVNAKFSATSIA